MAVLKLSIFFFFFVVVFYAKGREASDNLYTVYTAHPPYNPYIPPPPVCIVPEHQNVKAPTPLPKNKQKNKQRKTCSASRGSCYQTGEPNPKE